MNVKGLNVRDHAVKKGLPQTNLPNCEDRTQVFCFHISNNRPCAISWNLFQFIGCQLKIFMFFLRPQIDVLVSTGLDIWHLGAKSGPLSGTVLCSHQLVHISFLVITRKPTCFGRPIKSTGMHRRSDRGEKRTGERTGNYRPEDGQTGARYLPVTGGVGRTKRNH